MSLNGLDTPDVNQAYQAAILEAGGWVLLRYATRDGVEILARGKGGVAEARGAIAKYEEKSPLYGLIIYRRRKVLIKYLPEGTSRLLQGTLHGNRAGRLRWILICCRSANSRTLPGCT